jgi:HEAT repeat protein
LASLAARKDLKDETRAKAVAGLAARRDEPTAELLAELAVDETILERMRIGAVRALRDRNDDRAVEPLLTRARQAREGSQFPDWPRCATLKALGATGDPRAFDLARELALDRRGTVSWDVQDAALQAIALTKDPRALPLLLKLLGGEGQPPPNQIVRVGAATALGILGDRRALPPLKAATQSTVYYEYNFNGQRGRVHLRDAAAGAIRAIG